MAICQTISALWNRRLRPPGVRPLSFKVSCRLHLENRIAGTTPKTKPVARVTAKVNSTGQTFQFKVADAALLHSLPLLVKSARAALESVDRSYERAARNLGGRTNAHAANSLAPQRWNSLFRDEFQ